MSAPADAAHAAGRRPQAPSGHLPGEPSMWFFVIGDLLIFGLYFVSYMYFRGTEHAAFLEQQRHLDQDLGVVNTVILLTSSLFVALGTTAARDGARREALRLFALAAACGTAFPLVKLAEWIPEVAAGHTPGSHLFFMYYYVLAGMHLCHVLLGLVILGFVMRHLRRSATVDQRFVESGATYWHMVDLLWLVLFALFYLVR